MPLNEREVDQALDRIADWLTAQPGVGGFATAADESGRSIAKIYALPELEQDTRQSIRQRLEPIPVEFVPSGPVQAY